MIKKIIILLNAAFLGVAVLIIAYSFFVPMEYNKHIEQIVPYNNQKVWSVLTDKRTQLNWRKDLVKQSVDTNEVNMVWGEFFSAKDSVGYHVIAHHPIDQYQYEMNNPKFELVSNFKYQLTPIDSNHTKIVIDEFSKSYNKWTSILFKFNGNEMNLQVELNRLMDGLKYWEAVQNKKI